MGEIDRGYYETVLEERDQLRRELAEARQYAQFLRVEAGVAVSQFRKLRDHFQEMSTRFHDANEHAVDFDECQVPRCKKNREVLGGCQ